MLILEVWLDQGPAGAKKLKEVGLFTNPEALEKYKLLNPPERHNNQYYKSRTIDVIE